MGTTHAEGVFVGYSRGSNTFTATGSEGRVEVRSMTRRPEAPVVC